MRVVLDSNVVIAALAARGLCTDVFEYCLFEHSLILSDALLHEIYHNLCKKIKISSLKAEQVRQFLITKAEIVKAAVLSPDACRDPDDIMVLGTAVAGNADVIVTGDDDLLILKKIYEIPILSPRGFWSFVQERQP